MDDRISELAHELKTPLTGVLGAIELVLDSPVPLDDTEVEELLAVARSEANQLRSIIDGILQRTKLETGTLAVDRQPVSVLEMVDDTLRRFPGVSDRTAVTGDSTLTASTDRSLAEQILTNLMQNVARYAPSGPVRIEMGRRGDDVTIVVSDSGPGLPGGEVPSSKGLGVGLATSTRLAETLGGSLRPVVSAGGTGATFELRLPASDQTVEPSEFAGAEATPPRARLLEELTDLLVGTSVDRILTGVGRLAREMLRAAVVRVFEKRGETLVHLAAEGDHRHYEIDPLAADLLSCENGHVADVVSGAAPWLEGMRGEKILATTMRSPDGLAGFLVTSWTEHGLPAYAHGVLPALAALSLVGIDRRSLGAELEFERRVRAEVLDSLPIAISVFVGDPPRLISWNRAEREMLGLSGDDDRPEPLQQSQRVFDVRFEDGTPLTVENAPVSETIRTGSSTGPFHLRLKRADGVEIVTRTYCAPVRDAAGVVIGAVVTSEAIDS